MQPILFKTQIDLIHSWLKQELKEGALPHRTLPTHVLQFTGTRLYGHLGLRDTMALIAVMDPQHLHYGYPTVLALPFEYLPGRQFLSALASQLSHRHTQGKSWYDPLEQHALLVPEPDLGRPDAHAENVRYLLDNFRREERKQERTRAQGLVPTWDNHPRSQLHWYYRLYATEVASTVATGLMLAFDVAVQKPAPTDTHP